MYEFLEHLLGAAACPDVWPLGVVCWIHSLDFPLAAQDRALRPEEDADIYLFPVPLGTMEGLPRRSACLQAAQARNSLLFWLVFLGQSSRSRGMPGLVDGLVLYLTLIPFSLSFKESKSGVLEA